MCELKKNKNNKIICTQQISWVKREKQNSSNSSVQLFYFISFYRYI